MKSTRYFMKSTRYCLNSRPLRRLYLCLSKRQQHAELETSQAKGRRGITRLSSSQIRRLEAAGQFPQSRQITGTRSRFYVAGEVKKWLTEQAS